MATGKRNAIYELCAAPIDATRLDTPENQMLFSRLCALALQESGHVAVSVRPSELHHLTSRFGRAVSDSSNPSDQFSEDRGSFYEDERDSAEDDDADLDDLEEDKVGGDLTGKRNTLKQLEKGKMGNYVYPSDYPAADWELASRRRLLIASSRYNIIDSLLPGYFHGHRPALQIDVAAFSTLLQDRLPALASHFRTLNFPLGRLVERWFLSLFTASLIPLPTVLRIWDAFFTRGVLVFYGVGLGLLFRAEETLFHAKTAAEAEEYLRASERSCIDVDSVFTLVFKDDLNIPWLSDEQLEKLRSTHRQRVMENVAQKVGCFKDKLGILKLTQDLGSRCQSVAKQFLNGVYGAKGALGSSVVDENAVGRHHNVLDDPYDDYEFNDGLGNDEEVAGGLNNSFQTCLKLLLNQTKEASATAETLAIELGQRQSKWLAVSSQLAACPLARPPTADSHSWLSQVKEGKISGAGHDASAMGEGFPSAARVIEASGMVFDTGDARLPSDDSIGGSNVITGERSFLLNEREDLSPSDHHLAEVFLYAFVSSLKALCAVRLECLSATYRFMWHGGCWLESHVEYPSHSPVAAVSSASSPASGGVPVPGTPNSRQTFRIKASSTLGSATQASTPSSASSKRRPRALDDSALAANRNDFGTAVTPRRGARPTTHSFYKPTKSPTRLRPSFSSGDFSALEFANSGVGTNLYDDPIIEGQPSPSSPTYDEPLDASAAYLSSPKVSLSPNNNAFAAELEPRRGLERGAVSRLDTSNKPLLAALTAQHQEGERVFREAQTRLLSGLGKFLRLEYRDKDWALRERALSIERELQQELQEIEMEVHGAQWLQH
ncbi:hypothetical protein BBJ28_00015046 [Nothophytophthora sp. Chile5]|nr:hypothetical protein BBJ28_00015046 [Nothophytophthora sp. Chile5]